MYAWSASPGEPELESAACPVPGTLCAMTARLSSSPAHESPAATRASAYVEASARDESPASDISRVAVGGLLELEQRRDELLAENAALRVRLELLSSLERAAWWDWDVKGERLTAHGDLVELARLDLPGDLGTPGLQRWLDLVHPDDARRARGAFARCVTEPGEIAACELRLRARAGGHRWVLLALTSSAELQRGRPLRVFGAARDVQGERAAQQLALRDAQILAHLDQGIVCADSDGIIAYCNGAAARLLGFRDRAWLGRSLFDAFPREEQEQLKTLAAAALEGATRSIELELELAADDGAKRALELQLTSYGEPGGAPLGVVCALRELGEPRASAPHDGGVL